MTHIIDTSTALFGNFVYHGTYGTYLGKNISMIPRNKRDAYQDDVAKMYLDEILAVAISDMLPSDIDTDFELTYNGTYHPDFYNFETDIITFTLSFSDDIKSWLENYAANNRDDFDKYLHKNFTSRDGFYSFTPNNYDDWYNGFVDDDSICVSVLISWILPDDDSYMYSFIDGCDEIAMDDYTYSEFAVKFKNGYVGYCVNDYDYDEEMDRYKAYLFDTVGNIVETSECYDPLNEYHFSAFAAWDCILEDDVTNKHEYVGYNYDDMDVSEFHSLFDGKFEKNMQTKILAHNRLNSSNI